jgi:hypothetical protein
MIFDRPCVCMHRNYSLKHTMPFSRVEDLDGCVRSVMKKASKSLIFQSGAHHQLCDTNTHEDDSVAQEM